MKLVKECWIALLDAFNALTGTPTDGSQQSLGFSGWPRRGHRPLVPHVPHIPHVRPVPHVPIHDDEPIEKDPLVFRPPSHDELKIDNFTCDYRAMGAGWAPCSTNEDRGCWLQGPPGTRRFDIDSDYENDAPKGITRKVFLSNSRCLYHDG